MTLDDLALERVEVVEEMALDLQGQDIVVDAGAQIDLLRPFVLVRPAVLGGPVGGHTSGIAPRCGGVNLRVGRGTGSARPLRLRRAPSGPTRWPVRPARPRGPCAP